MKIGIDGRLINRHQNTGISRYTDFLIEYYAKKYGEENLSIITNDYSLQVGNCKIIYTKLRPFNIVHFLLYRKTLSKLSFDLLHIPFYSGIATQLPKTKIIVTVHDLMYKLVSDFFGKNELLNFAKRKYFDFIVERTVRTADAVVTISETTKRDLYKQFQINSIHIPEFSDIDTKSNNSILERFELSDKKYFFYCGNNRPHKNLQFVIDTFNALPNLPPLVLAGKGHKTGTNVKAVGVVSEEELKALYKSSIAFIFPSKYEGFGLPILEALNSKTLVIASRIPAFLEFKSKNILFFDLTNRKQLVEAIQIAQKKAFVEENDFFKKYSISNIYELLDNLLASNFDIISLSTI